MNATGEVRAIMIGAESGVKTKINAMIVDDNRGDCIVVKRKLEQLPMWDVDCSTMESGAEAIAGMKEQAPDVVFMDYMLGSETGTDIVHQLKEAGCNASFILLTGRGGEEAAVEALREGVSDYISKQELSPEILDRSLRLVFERKMAALAIKEAHEILEQVGSRNVRWSSSRPIMR